jgi:REP element-mobilizing transposase RayT
MARPLRIEIAGAHYHVMARGNARQNIFHDDEDRQRFLLTVGQTAARLDWVIAAFCLMPNHYHLLLQTRSPTLTRGMRDINGVYSQTFNRRHGRVGHMFQGRYKALLIEEAGYLLQVARYIVLNPVRAALCTTPAEWPWSSYRFSAGLEAPPPGCSDAALRVQLGATSAAQATAYVSFVAAGLGEPLPPSSAPSGIIGSLAFGREVGRHVGNVSHEVPRRERRFERIADYVQRAESRDAAILQIHASGLFTLTEIGEHFGVSCSRVSHIVRKGQAGLRARGGRGTVQESRPDPVEAPIHRPGDAGS